MSDDRHDDARMVGDVRDKAHELARLLDGFSERLRRMRQRNREIDADIASFERHLQRLRRRLEE
jgi:hypothetical protein